MTISLAHAIVPLLSYTRSSLALFTLSPLLVTAPAQPISHPNSTLSLRRYFCSTSALSITSSRYPRNTAFSLRRCSLYMYHLIFFVRRIIVSIGSSNCRFFYPMHSWCATVNMLYLFLNNQAHLLEILSLLLLTSPPLPPHDPADSTLLYSCYLVLLLYDNLKLLYSTTQAVSSILLGLSNKQRCFHLSPIQSD